MVSPPLTTAATPPGRPRARRDRASHSRADRYFQPPSARSTTTDPPSISRATRTATATAAPHDSPAKMPSSWSSRRRPITASRLLTRNLSSRTDSSSTGGTNPSSSERSPCTFSPGSGSAATIRAAGPGPLQVTPDAGQGAAGPEAGDEDVDVGHLLEDLRAGRLLVRPRICLVAVLVRHEEARVRLRQRLGEADGAVRALGSRREDDLGSEQAKELLALGGRVVGHHDPNRVPQARADHRQADAGVAARGLQDRLAGTQRPVGHGRLDHGPRDAVLDAAGRVVALQLGVQAHALVRREAPQLDHRRVADGGDQVGCRADRGRHRSSVTLRPWRAGG